MMKDYAIDIQLAFICSVTITNTVINNSATIIYSTSATKSSLKSKLVVTG